MEGASLPLLSPLQDSVPPSFPFGCQPDFARFFALSIPNDSKQLNKSEVLSHGSDEHNAPWGPIFSFVGEKVTIQSSVDTR